jgi:hypothetical protein
MFDKLVLTFQSSFSVPPARMILQRKPGSLVELRRYTFHVPFLHSASAGPSGSYGEKSRLPVVAFSVRRSAFRVLHSINECTTSISIDYGKAALTTLLHRS